MDFNLSEVK